MKKGSTIKLFVVIALILLAVVLSIKPLTEKINLGLDLQGGAEVVLQAIPDQEGGTVTNADMQQLVTVLSNRVDELGVSEPIIQIEGKDRIIVQLAGVDNPDEAIALIGKTAKLEFVDPYGNVILSGSQLSSASAQINNSETAANKNQVALKFNKEGTDAFYAATAQFLGQVIEIRLDGETISAPRVNAVIANGEAVISGGFETFEQASQLASLLNGGALPVNLEILSKQTVGPTLGADSLSKSLNAALIGFIILFAFMMLYYRLPGIWACFSLLLYALILLWMLNWVNATLTLTSIAGFILSVGVAVDANIIIYERIREELYHGKSLKASIDSGFKRAFLTILDSNITTLIAAVVLYIFGSGTIRGFALTLSIGIIASMFTAIIVTRQMLRWMSDTDFLSNKKLYGGI